MQRIFNYGSSLQAYGLKRLIESLANDIGVSFVDYRPGQILVQENGADVPNSKFARTLAKVKEYSAVNARLTHKIRFFNHKRTYAAKYFPLIGIPTQQNYDLDLDVLVIGSDEVFNCVQSNTNVGYSRDLFGHRSPAGRTISYAGSFGNTTLQKIDAFGLRPYLQEDFARFAAISVRDLNSARIVEELAGHRPVMNVDPVLAYDFMRLEPGIPGNRPYDGKYIIVYSYSGRLSRAENVVLKKYAREAGVKIFCFGGVHECGDRFVDCDPFELLAYFRDAEAVVTDTFHGTIFSIINNRPFGTIVRPSVGHGYGNEEKLGHLLETFGLSTQRVTEMAGIGKVLENVIDYGAVNRTLAEERARTLEFLESAVLSGEKP